MKPMIGKTMGLLAAALLPLAGLAAARPADVLRNEEKKGRSAKVHRCSLTAVRPDAELKQELLRYGLKAYSCTDGTNVVRALHYAPKAVGTKRYPMVVYLPGSGERGDLIRQFRQRRIFEIVTDADFQRRHPCHLIALSPPEWLGTLVGGSPEKPTSLQRLLHDTILEVANASSTGVDLKRLYITGFSYGGAGAYALAQHYPGEYAAVVPIATFPPPARYFKAEHPGSWWHFHNEHEYDDYPEGMADLKDYQKKTNESGGDFRVGVYPATGHDAWHRAWDEEEVWTWMFGKTTASSGMRKRAPARLTVKPAEVNLANVRCTASVGGRDGGAGPERVVDGLDSTDYRPERPFGKEDWWKAEFPSPVAGKVQIFSGDRSGKGRLKNAVVEVSSNGKTWSYVGSFSEKDGSCTFTRNVKFSYVRVRIRDAKAQDFVLRRLSLVASR